MILRALFSLATILSLVCADVAFTGPAAGDSITGTSLDISWEESNTAPPITDFTSYQLFLCAGGNDATNYIQLATLVPTGDYSQGDTVTVAISTGLGAPTKNAYFLKMISIAAGGSVVNFSKRFSLPSMTGVFPAAVIQGLATVSGTSGPATQNNIQSPQVGGGVGSAAAGGEYGTPYTMQTGAVRYAPMPPMAVTQITAKNPSRLWPTSAYSVYATNAGSPNAITTNTAPLTFVTTSIENPISAAAVPAGDGAMSKFLNRWKD